MLKNASFKKKFVILACVVIAVTLQSAVASTVPQGDTYTNSIGMKFVRIEPGTFKMGQLEKLPPELLFLIEGGHRGGRMDLLENGDFDEKPVHKVQITQPFYMGVCEVTNKQYELFDPAHKEYRGKNGYSKKDNEAVLYVSWYDATAFCRWLSDRENLYYRLPTEAEWEYACRAGSSTNFHTGKMLPEIYIKHLRRWDSHKPFLGVGQTPRNKWGLYDMHGNVEEWCYDWYGPYKKGTQKDPVGYKDGNFKVTRGGSHGTFAYYMRSANRMGTVPAERTWKIGFRVLIGPLPESEPVKSQPVPRCMQNVKKRNPEKLKQGPDEDKPYFKWHGNFVKIPRQATGPLFAGHNHSPFIITCPNGDLLANWFSCVSEVHREMTRAGSRLRWGRQEWEPASLFWNIPDRNDSGAAMWNDGKGNIYHFIGIGVGAGYTNMSMALRKSSDSGKTWSKARIIRPEHTLPRGIWGGQLFAGPVFRMNNGDIDAVTDGYPTLWISPDEGLTWEKGGGTLNGNHPGVIQLKDGTLLGFYRDNEVPDKQVVTVYDDMGKKKIHKQRPRRMAKCFSYDNGKTWSHQRSKFFPGIGGGQRLVLMKLENGDIMFASFAKKGIMITDAGGNRREVRGLFVAVSEDQGKSWSNVRLVSDDGPGTAVGCTNNGYFCMSQRNAEYRGYLDACQGTNGLIHLISSYEHYSFNLKWLKTPPPPLKYPPKKVEPVVETFEGPEDFDAPGWGHYHGHKGGFNGNGQYRVISKSHFQGLNRLVGKGSFEMKIEARNIKFNPRGPTASPGLTVWIKDAMTRRLHFYVRDNRISCGLFDQEDSVPFSRSRDNWVQYDRPPDSVKLRFIYNESKRQVRIFYGLNGDDANTELTYSKKGIYFGKKLSESTAAYLLFSNCRMDLDYFEINPLPGLDAE